MKNYPLAVILAVIGGSPLGFAGDEPTAVLEPQPSPITATRTFIPDSLDVPGFTPPTPAVEKRVPVMRVDSAITLPAEGSRMLTIVRGEASTLPDLPIPQKPKLEEPRPLTLEDAADIARQRRHTLHIGATTYEHRISHVQWQHPDTGETYEALCGFDIGLLEGTGGFIHDGESYSLMLMISAGDSRLDGDSVPDLTKIPAGSITILRGNPEDPIGVAPVAMLKDLIASEKSRLVTYQAARQRYLQAAAAWQKAHPPVPRDETVWFRPHRGSRYLANPTPEAAVK